MRTGTTPPLPALFMATSLERRVCSHSHHLTRELTGSGVINPESSSTNGTTKTTAPTPDAPIGRNDGAAAPSTTRKPHPAAVDATSLTMMASPYTDHRHLYLALCKFSAHGACLKGEHCEFSHDWKDPPNNICTFYQNGVCAYGSRCRYEHIKVAETPVAGTVAGDCPCAENCSCIHGDNCLICRKRCFPPQEREEHLKICEKREKRLETLRKSQEIECSVCLDRVLSKPVIAERKFGILPECNHPYCISCIRSWRSSSPASGLDVNSALRACPICRKISYFVVPSVIWFASKQEKQGIIDNYKAKLSTIDCKHFYFGNGTCPFGASCFYKHAYRDGRLEKVILCLLGSEDGNTLIAKNIRLSNILGNLQTR